MQYTNQSHLKAAITVSDLPDSSPLLAILKCLKDNVRCGRLRNAFLQWFREKRKKGITFSYGFTGLEWKYFWCHFATLIQELLKISSLSYGSVVKLHTSAFAAVKFRDAVSIYSRVEVHIEQVEKLKTSCQHFFNATCLLLNVVTSTVRTIAISYHTSTHYPLHTSYATLRGWSGPTLSTPAVIQNFVGAPFSYWSQNPFVSPLLGKFPYFFSLTSKYWRYSCHTNSFITAD